MFEDSNPLNCQANLIENQTELVDNHFQLLPIGECVCPRVTTLSLCGHVA